MSPSLPSLSRMQASDHYCGIFRNDEDHRRLTLDFIRQGVERREKMLYIVNLQSAAQLKAVLEAGGIDAEALTRSGQLVILTAKDAYLKDAEFDPDRMIALLGAETDKALAEGFTALGVTGEMTWALGGEPGSERLVEYEAKLNRFFPGKPCYAVCQYDNRRFDAEMLTEILHTHPKVLFGTEAYDNRRMYFVPPEAYLSPNRPLAVLDTWLHNLSVHHHRPQ